jgi:integrase
VYFLAEQMGTSVHMIESHYGHVNTIKHADRVLSTPWPWYRSVPVAAVPSHPASNRVEAPRDRNQ